MGDLARALKHKMQMKLKAKRQAARGNRPAPSGPMGRSRVSAPASTPAPSAPSTSDSSQGSD